MAFDVLSMPYRTIEAVPRIPAGPLASSFDRDHIVEDCFLGLLTDLRTMIEMDAFDSHVPWGDPALARFTDEMDQAWFRALAATDQVAALHQDMSQSHICLGKVALLVRKALRTQTGEALSRVMTQFIANVAKFLAIHQSTKVRSLLMQCRVLLIRLSGLWSDGCSGRTEFA